MVIVTGSYVAGAIPFSNLVARRTRGVDLRRVGSGTVSGTALYRVAGFGPLAIGGVLDVAKGAAGPLLCGRSRPGLAAVAGGAAVSGHNWSPFLGGAGGRGIAPALGALLVQTWPGTAILGAGLAVGRLARKTALGSLLSYIVLVPALAHWRGRRAAGAGAAVVVPLVVKRLAGNRLPADPRSMRTWLGRLLYDRDPCEDGS
jgi:glycerol-3-phosphate acyltransferase PlsY